MHMSQSVGLVWVLGGVGVWLSILDSIYVYRVHDYIEQIAVVTSLEKFLDEHPRVKLVGFPSPFCRPRWS